MTIAPYGRAPKLGDDLRQLIGPSGDQARFYFEFSAHARSGSCGYCTGCDFDSFTKVVLCHNEFDAFLRGKLEERRSILTRLLSPEIYGAIQQRANLVATDANAQAEVLTGQLASLSCGRD